MSTSTESSRRPSRELPEEPAVRRSSKYDIYGSVTKPFGESYRRSLVENQQHAVEDSGTMGCNTSKKEMSTMHEGSFSADCEVEKNVTKSKDTAVVVAKTLNDFELIYGSDADNSSSSGDKLVQITRDRDEETTLEAEGQCGQIDLSGQNANGSKLRGSLEEGTNTEVKCIASVRNSDPVSFVEEEYSYEPGQREPTSKLVVRSRSLATLDQPQPENARRPNAMKITTKPDGSIRYGLRQGFSESDLLDSDESPTREKEVKNSYVSSIKSAFDVCAATESQKEGNRGRAEAFDGLKQYFHENRQGLQELLINNNVVIIEPYRHEVPESPSDNIAQRTCRITGATTKSPTSEPMKPITDSNTLPRRNTKNQQHRQGFYHPIKVNKEIIDTELPDPEKVKSAREWFEQIFKSKSTPQISSKKSPSSFFNTISSKSRVTPEVKVVQPRRLGRVLPSQKRWTDSGSLSSGVSSDLSCDQDCEFHHQPDILEEYSTDEEYEDNELHPVSTEVLQKIRACGTTVTYYGGKVISRSHGQLRSPMTMSIMDEIRQSVVSSEPYLGVKFRLVKSNSCGSRLEITGTEDVTSPRHESIAESREEEEYKTETDRTPQTMTWADLKLKEARKQWHCAPEAVRIPAQDMEFETFEVLEDSHTNTETGRG